ncbi:MAG: hypothetical protein ACRC37_03485, partial [Lentisphaeria bacterium]
VAKPSYIHLSTRQNCQLHNVDPLNVIPALQAGYNFNIPFIGGGGNTFRNIKASLLSGLRYDSIFDIRPYAQLLNELFPNWTKAYSLPRKLKIGFFDSNLEHDLAIMQDLGFLAKIENGIHGFTVFAAGGIGRNSSVGIKLFEFISADKAPQIAYAINELFHDHGNRQNRAASRLRYLLSNLGEDNFRNLFLQYFHQAQTIVNPQLPLPKHSSPQAVHVITNPPLHIDNQFDLWKTLNTFTTIDQKIAVHVRVPEGNITVKQLLLIKNLLDQYLLPAITLTENQDFYIEQVDNEILPHVYNNLKIIFENQDFKLNSFRGNIISCVGSKTCKVGIADSPDLALRVADALDNFFHDKPELKLKFADKIIAQTRISGCPSSCSLHPVATVGVNGTKRKIDGEMQTFWQPSIKQNPDDILATPTNEMIPDCEAPQYILNKIVELIINK